MRCQQRIHARRNAVVGSGWLLRGAISTVECCAAAQPTRWASPNADEQHTVCMCDMCRLVLAAIRPLAVLQQREDLRLVVVGHARHTRDARKGQLLRARAVGDLAAAGDVRIRVIRLRPPRVAIVPFPVVAAAGVRVHVRGEGQMAGQPCVGCAARALVGGQVRDTRPRQWGRAGLWLALAPSGCRHTHSLTHSLTNGTSWLVAMPLLATHFIP